MRNLHLIILQESGIEARCLLREWERLRLRSSDYKNHRIFSLRCIHEELIPVSIKLKSTLDTPKARQIIRKAEKDLLQARVKAINNILAQVEKEIQDCRAKLASIISQVRLEQCQDFINKVSELRFNKVKQRQINKLNHLVSKKEGNITIITLNRQAQTPPSPHSRNPTLATALLPPGEGDNSPPVAVHLPTEGNSSPNSQASNNNNNTSNSSNQTNSQASQVPPLNQTLAIAHLPPGEVSNSPLGATHLPPEAVGSPPQPNSTTAIDHLPPREGSNSLPGATHLHPEAVSSPPQPNSTTATAHLPPGEGSNSLLGATHLHPEADGSPPQPNSTTAREENNSSQASSPPVTNHSSRASQAGHSNNPPRASRQGTRHPQSSTHSTFP